MNRRSFIASIPFLPPAIRAAVAGPAPYTVEQLMNCPPNPNWAAQASAYPYYKTDIDEIFNRLYALKKYREENEIGRAHV